MSNEEESVEISEDGYTITFHSWKPKDVLNEQDDDHE